MGSLCNIFTRVSDFVYLFCNYKWFKYFESKILMCITRGVSLQIYQGYVDDPRNTDNAWMETVAKNFHDDTGITNSFQLEGGDDAYNSKWQECSSELKLYASHKEFIQKTVKKHAAHW